MIKFHKNISNKRVYFNLISATALLLVVLFLGYVENKKNAAKNVEVQKEEVAKIEPIKKFVVPNILARAVYVFDVKDQKVLYQKNATVPLPLASITKVMTAVVASELIPQKSIIELAEKDVSTEGDSGLKVGERWNLRDLLGFSLIVSSNDGMTAVANAISSITQKDFVTSMNDKALSLNLPTLSFTNSTGLDNEHETVPGAIGSAEDVARLFTYAISNHSELLDLTKYNSYLFKTEDGVFHNAHNTDKVLDKIPGIIASKTGYTDLAGGNLVVAFDAGLNHPVVIVVLGSTQDGRFDDMVALASSTIGSL